MSNTNQNQTEQITAPSGRIYRVRVVPVGINFGCIGQVLARNGRVVAETGCYPCGTTSAALAMARALAKTL